MKLYIAEKPSLGRAIADVLPKPHRKEDGCIRVGNGDVVSWCVGHLLEQAEPEAYGPEYKKWCFEHLPIVPTQWQLQPKSSSRKQLTVLRKLVKEARSIVHAGDPDREGQLLVDQVLDYLKVSGQKRDATERLLVNDLNPAAVTRALGQMRSNREFIPLSTSALARSRADWLYGINLTRAYTLQGRKAGYGGLLSVGRVQTPVLGMVVRRDAEIEHFVTKPYYEVLAHVSCASAVGDDASKTFTAKWQPSEACAPYMDEEGRVIFKRLAETVVAKITGQNGIVESVEKKQKTQAAPLPYSLSALQIDAAKRYGYNAKRVLDVCQALYERHKLITYPRSDSRYLPVEHLKQARGVLGAIRQNAPSLMAAVDGANTALKSRAWNDKKVDAHHAIIPTEKSLRSASLSADESNVYQLIARQYIAQFYGAWKYSDTLIHLSIAGGSFVAKARTVLDEGWKVLFPQRSKKIGAKPGAGDTNEEEYPESHLPPLKKGDALHCNKGELLEKQTQPPKHFTDATLLSAMTGIARFVSDPTIKKILKETDGLGTEATRAGIIELLFKRNFLTREGKAIKATPAGCALIGCLPLSTTTPDMTAQWECSLNAISQAQKRYPDFMNPLLSALRALVVQSHQSAPSGFKNLPAPSKSVFRKKRKARPKKPQAV